MKQEPDPIQSIGAPSDATALVRAQTRGPLEGHALPEALSGLGSAFRSQPAWTLIYQWTKQVMEDHQNAKQELVETKRKLETGQADLFDMKIKNVELTQKLKIAEKSSISKNRWQGVGFFFLGLSPAAYLNTVPIYGYLLGGVGLLFLVFAWREDIGK